MTTAYDPYGVPDQRREPVDPLLELPDHPSGEWAMRQTRTPRPPYGGRRPYQQQQHVGHPRPARTDEPYLPSYSSQAAYPMVSAVPAAAGRSRVKPLAAGAAVVLLAVSGWLVFRLQSVGHDNDRLTAAMSAEQNKSAQLTDRTGQLEKQLAGVFNPQAISAAVLPSVFRVRAGEFTGTAFAVGDGPKVGQSALLTNFHVVESVYNAGTRKVFLERGNDELSATITKVNKTKDLALLTVSKKITGLVAATATVQPGQQVVVVGAPLGLEDTVTTGVVSAYRQEANGPTVQFDAPINPGNSGGPVVAANDQVLGLATAKAKDAEGIGLAIPIKTACDAFPGVC